MLSRSKDRSVLLVLITLSIFVLVGLAFSEDWNSYNPSHSLGSGDEDWWTTYPDQNANSGSTVSHPTWILDALKENPLTAQIPVIVVTAKELTPTEEQRLQGQIHSLMQKGEFMNDELMDEVRVMLK